MEKKTKIALSVIGGGLAVIAIILIIKQKQDDDIKKELQGAGNTEEDILDKDLPSYDKYFVDTFNPIELAKTNAALKEQVKTLQTRLNAVMKEKKIDLPQLKVDGFFGRRTMRAVVYVLGDRLLPLKSEEQIGYFITQLK